MQISGIVVVCRSEHLAEVRQTIDAFPWAEVHHVDPKGRLVVTIEAKDTNESIAYVRTLQGLPHVQMAEMAEFVDDNPSA